MGSSYAGKRSGGGSSYARGGTVGPGRKKQEGHHGALGFVENLGEDIGKTVVGIPAGLKETVEHPIRTAENIGRTYRAQYAPLLHGDVSKFMHQLYSHPLGYALDALTVATLGAGVAVKAGVLPAAARGVELRAPNALVKATRPIVGNEVSRRLKIGVQKALNRLPYDTPHLGEAARYIREAERLPRREAHRLLKSAEARAYNKAVRKLDNHEFVALHLIGNDIHPLDYAAALKTLQAQGERVEPAMFKVLENPQVVEAFERPDARLQKAVDAAEALSRKDAEVKIGHGVLDPETAAARPGKHRASIEATRPTPGRPFYVPDVPFAKRVANPGLAKQGLGKGVAHPVVYQNRGVLFRTGQLALNADVLSPEFLKTVKYGLADDLHATLMSGAARVSREEAFAGMIPRGWTLIPKEVVSKTGAKRPAKIHPLIRSKHAALEEMEAAVGDDIAKRFTVKDLSDAATLHGDYLIVPERMLKQVVGEFTRSNAAIRLFFEKPTRVWRALVLGLRVGFLTNNVVGNHLIYMLRAAGLDGLRAYLNAVKRVHGKGMVRTLLEDREIPEALRARFMDEFFPEQAHGSFGETQQVGGKIGRAARKVGGGVLPATQAVSETNLRRALVEFFIRKSPEFKQVYRAMPRQARDFEAAAERILKGGGGPEFQARVSHEVNNVLGDYLNLSKAERDVLRAVFPFYSWYKAITRITTSLAVDTPGRADLLAKIGHLGVDDTTAKLGEIPSYLRGLIPLGQPHDGDQTVLATGGLNPFQTVSQIGAGAVGLLAGQPGETGKAFSELGPNPGILALIQQLSGKELFTGRDIDKGAPGLPAQIVAQVGAQLPQVTLAKALAGHGRESKLYGQQSGRDALLQFLGVPVKDLDLPRAHQAAVRGRNGR